jgi:hypothetical protein
MKQDGSRLGSVAVLAGAVMAVLGVVSVIVVVAGDAFGQTRSGAPRPIPPTSTGQQSAQGGNRVLHAPLKLAPMFVTGAFNPPHVSLAGLKVCSGMVNGSGDIQNLLAAMQQKAGQCTNRSYSVQDQTAAGCVSNDTVEQCSKKLYAHCMQHPPGMTLNSYGMALKKKLSGVLFCEDSIKPYKEYIVYLHDYYVK